MVNQVGKLRRKQPKRSPCWPCDRRLRRRSHGQQGEPGCSNRSVISQRTLFTIQASWMGSQIPQATAFLARKEWHGDFACLPAHTCKNSVRPLHGNVHWTTSLEPCQHRSCRSPTTMPVCPASCTALASNLRPRRNRSDSRTKPQLSRLAFRMLAVLAMLVVVAC
jgi:hypothetical protein